MKRNIIQQGASYTITLPKKWVEDNNLKNKDEIELDEDNNQLILKGKGQGKRQTIKVNIPHSTRSLTKSIISNAYKKGYDIIEVTYEDDSTAKVIEKVVHDLMGHEIMDKKSHFLIIKNISTELEEEYDNIFRKSFFLCKENMAIIKEEIKELSFQRLEEVQETRNLITKYTDYCKRIITKNRRNNETSMFEYIIIWTLEKISNEINYLYRYLHTNAPKLNKEDIKSLNLAFHLFDNIMVHYFKKDVSYLHEFSKEKDQFLHERFDKLITSKSVNQVVLHRAGNIVRRCQDIVGPFYGSYL